MADYDVFISYSRVDTGFVRSLEAALKERQRAAWVDWQGIDYSTKWWDEICAGIERSHHFVLVISPDSLNSVYCQREIEHARRQGKHIIPLLYRPLNETEMIGGWYTHKDMKSIEALARENWEAIKSIQWINHEKLGTDVATTIATLEETIDRDPACIKAHTQLLLQMQTWQSSGRSPSALLNGDILKAAEEHLVSCNDKVIFTADQQTLVSASRKAEDTRNRQIAEDNWRTRRLRLAALAAGIIGVLALLATGGAVSQMVVAGNNATTAQANVASAQVEATRIGLDVMNGQAQLQANRSQIALADGDRTAALNLALDSLRDYPIVFRSESSLVLSSALSTSGRDLFNLQYPGPLAGVTWNADQTQVLAWGVDGNADVYDITSGQPLFALHPPASERGFDPKTLMAAWNADETHIFTLRGYEIFIWDAANGALLSTLNEPNFINGARWNRAGTQILTWGYGYVWIWDVQTGTSLITFSDGDTDVLGALWNPDETRILTWEGDSALRIWNVTSGVRQAIMQHEVSSTVGTEMNIYEIGGAVWNKDGTRVLSWSSDKTARVWDAKTGDNLLTLTHDDWVVSASWKPSDESQILTTSAQTATIWDAKTGKQIMAMKHDKPINGAAWDADSFYVLTWAVDGSIRQWNPTSEDVVETLHHSNATNEDTFAPPRIGAAYGSDSRFVPTWGKDLVRFWKGDKLLLGLPFQTQAADPYNQIDLENAQINNVQSRILAWTKNGAIRVWSTDGGANVLKLDAKTASEGAIWSKDEQHLLTWSMGKDGAAAILDATGKQLLHFGSPERIYSAQWSPDETRVMTRNLSEGIVNVWDARVGTAPPEQTADKALLTLHHDDLKAPGVFGMVFSPNGQRIATWNMVGVMRIWDANSDAKISQFGEDKPEPDMIIGAPRGAVWSADNQRLLHWADDNLLHISDTDTGKSLVNMQHHYLLLGALWSHDEKRILSWSLDGTLRLWNAADGSPVFKPIYVGTEQPIGMSSRDFAQSAVWNKDETRILVGTGAGNIEVYDASSGQLIMRFKQRNGRIFGAVWSPDETRVLSWSDDSSVEVGDVATGETQVRVLHGATVQGASWSADGQRILSWSWDNTARIWDATTGEPLLRLERPG